MAHKQSRKLFQERLHNMIRTIRSEIMSGHWQEGDFLPPEKTLARSYDLSNKSVRQGLDRLVTERFIEKIPRIGNKVTAPPAAADTTVRFGYYPSLVEQAALNQLLEEFREQHPCIQVEPIPLQAGTTYETLKLLMDSGMLDVITLNYSGLAEFAERGTLDELATLHSKPDVYPFLTQQLSFEGELKMQPLIFSPLMLCYNKDHFRSRNMLEPDSGWRWSSLSDHASALSADNERLGFYFHFPSVNRWPIFLLQSGLRFERVEHESLNRHRPLLLESLRMCRELIHMQSRFPQLLSEQEADAEELFFSGKVSMIITSYFSLNHPMRQPKFRYDIAPLPYWRDPGTLLLIIGLAVRSRSAAKDSALVLVDFLLSSRAQLIIRQKTLSIPSLKPAAEWTGKDSRHRPSRFHMYREIIPTFRVITDLRMSLQDIALLQKEARLYWSGLETEAEMAARLEQLFPADQQ